jgi:hypothetical protein
MPLHQIHFHLFHQSHPDCHYRLSHLDLHDRNYYNLYLLRNLNHRAQGLHPDLRHQLHQQILA